MVPLRDVIYRLDGLLEPAQFEDYGPNGLQVPGRSEIRRIVTGVTASRALIDRALELEADLVLVHHGLFWGPVRGLSPALAGRLRPLLAADVGLAAYHLPLDAHPTVGNNALLAGLLGCATHEPFAGIGRVGTFDGDGVGIDELVARVRDATGGREPLLQGDGPGRVRTIGIISGGAAGHLEQAIEAGLDAFLTGEPREAAMAEAEEGAIHFLAAGHYATETHGIRRIGELLEAELDVESVFVDLPNPV